MAKRIGIYVLAVAYLLVGCATTGEGDSITKTSSNNPEQVCNSLIISVIAGLGCGLISDDKNRVRNGLICAAAGYVGCMVANSYKAEQIKTAKQVEDEQLRQKKILPTHATLASYVTNVNPKGAVSKGQSVNVSSDIVVIPGRNNGNVKIEEEMTLLDSAGDQWGKSVRKQANLNGEAGQYRTSFTIPVHKDMSQGVYTVRKALYLDGTKISSNDKGKFQIVAIDSETRVASLQ